MPRYFNSSNRPIRYNSDGQIVGAGEWFTSIETPEIRSSLQLKELVEVVEQEETEAPKRRSRKTSE